MWKIASFYTATGELRDYLFGIYTSKVYAQQVADWQNTSFAPTDWFYRVVPA